jgi:hypothetical protein
MGQFQTSLYVPGGVLCGKIARHAALGERDGKVDAAIVASASLIDESVRRTIYGEPFLLAF